MTGRDGPLRIAVLNDFEVVVSGLASMLVPHADRVVVVEQDVGAPVTNEVDIVLYDSFGTARSIALEAESLIASGQPRLVVFTWDLDERLVRECLAAGVSGYLSKSLSSRALVSSLERIHAGEIVVPESSDGAAPRSAVPGLEHGLSPRESEMIALVVRGLSNKEIASRSYLSINSVKTYIRTAYRKMEVTSRSQAVLWGVRNGFSPDAKRVE